MSNLEIIRAWKDEEYRDGLTAQGHTSVPDHPAGLVELDDADLGDAAGGTSFVCEGISVSVLTWNFSCYTFCKTVCGGSCPSPWSGCCPW